MIYGSVCSGIEAASVAWHPLGWRPAFLSEIEPFPRAVLAHHYSAAPLHGDFTTIQAEQYDAIDVLVGGTPCQSFSIAGLRGGMADDRGNLALEYLRLADRLRPRWLVWENVPGVLSSNGGRDFGSLLGGLGQLGYGFAYRVLDAQYFGLAQRRKRVFVVGYLGDWRPAAAVLFEPESLRGHPAPRREAGQRIADTLTVCANQCSGTRSDFTEHTIAGTLGARASGGGDGGTDFECSGGVIAARIVPSLTSNPYGDHESREGLLVAQSYAIQERAVCENPNAGPDGMGVQADVAYTLEARSTPQAVAFSENQQGAVWESEVCQALNKGGGKPGQGYAAIRQASTVRRLTPRECERLQGFPDDYTAITYRGKPAADGNRYKALGNSMAVPCMAWIGKRIADVDASF